jgi:hypothetical protein
VRCNRRITVADKPSEYNDSYAEKFNLDLSSRNRADCTRRLAASLS